MRQDAVPPIIQGAIDELRGADPALEDRIVERIRHEVPDAERVSPADLRASVQELLTRTLDGLGAMRDPTEEELAAARGTGRRRAADGETMLDVLRSHRIGIREGWVAFQEIAHRRGIGARTQMGFSEALWRWADAMIDAAIDGHRELELARARDGARGPDGGAGASRLEVLRLEQREAFVTADGSTIRELAGVPTGNAANQSLAEATVPPGGETIEHYHRRSEEIYTFTAGAGRMVLGDEEADVRAGDSVVIAPGVPHKLHNPGPEPLVLLCCCAPPYSHEDTVLLDEG